MENSCECGGNCQCGVETSLIVDYQWLNDLFDQLYEECAHGDDEHRKWLKDKFDDFKHRVVTNAV